MIVLSSLITLTLHVYIMGIECIQFGAPQSRYQMKV